MSKDRTKLEQATWMRDEAHRLIARGPRISFELNRDDIMFFLLDQEIERLKQQELDVEGLDHLTRP